MSSSGSSSRRHLLTVVDTVHNSLNDPDCEIDHWHRVKLIHTLHEFKHQLQFDSVHHQQHGSSDMTKAQDSIAKVKMSELMSLVSLDSMLSSNTPNNSTPEPSDENLKKAYSCFFLQGSSEGAAAVVNKKQLVYWWVGQGLIGDNAEDDADAAAAAQEILNGLVEGGHIEQLTCSKWRKKLCKYRVNNESVDQQKNVVMLKTQERGLLGLVYPNGETIDEKSITKEGIESLFNRDVSILNTKLVDKLRKVRNSLKVLQLGRWSSDKAEKHIEVDNVEVLLKYLKELRKVRLISLRGISRIMELGEEICSLGNNLRVLDLQACPNLEVLPKGIGRLKNLTHLDLSECYLLDRIPKGIISLTKLQVLEGFVIGDVITSSSCKFKDLATHLGKNLRKLSIRTRKATFPEKDDLKVFSMFDKLLRLKLVWVHISNTDYDDEEEKPSQDKVLQQHQTAAKTNNDRNEDARGSFLQHLRTSFQRVEGPNAGLTTLPPKLQKLEVQAIPQSMVETLLWHNNNKLDSLKKLSIIGGLLIDLIDQGKIKWEMIEALQLKHLSNLHMNWREFREAFPNVKYLYKTRCPNLSFFQCDDNGVWRKS